MSTLFAGFSSVGLQIVFVVGADETSPGVPIAAS